MQVASNSGLAFNSKKYQIKHPQVTIFGTIFSKEGINLTLNNQRIIEMSPSDIQQLQAF